MLGQKATILLYLLMQGDILFLHMSNAPIRAGEIVVFNIDGRDIPIVHRVIRVHEKAETGEVEVLTKGELLLDQRCCRLDVVSQTLYHKPLWFLLRSFESS